MTSDFYDPAELADAILARLKYMEAASDKPTPELNFRRRCRGLTLIELLVALTLGVLLAVSVQSLVVRAYRNSAALETRVAKSDHRNCAIRVIEADLRALSPAGNIQLDENGLSFVTLNSLDPRITPPRHAVEVRYSLVERADTAWTRSERELGSEQFDKSVSLRGDVQHVTYGIYDGREWQLHRTPPFIGVARAVRRHLAGHGWHDDADHLTPTSRLGVAS